MFEKLKEKLHGSDDAMAIQGVIMALVVSILIVVIGGYIMQSVWTTAAINNTSIFYNGTVALPNAYDDIIGMGVVVFIVIFAAIVISLLMGSFGNQGGKRGK